MRTTALAALAAAAALLAALPASAATPTFKATVGPGFTISMATKPKTAGKIKLVIADKSNIHNFHLKGAGLNIDSGIARQGTKTYTITLKRGKYTFVCDPHASSMKGSFTVS